MPRPFTRQLKFFAHQLFEAASNQRTPLIEFLLLLAELSH